MSAALDIVTVALSRVADISITNGYETDIGLVSSIAEQQYNPDEITSGGAVNVFDSEDTNEDDETIGTEYEIRMPLSVEGHIRVGAGNAVTIAHSVLSDIKKAVLLVDNRTMSGLVLDVRYTDRSIEYPKAAGDVVSVKVNFYVIYIETYGSP